jgi:hypothetical protein
MKHFAFDIIHHIFNKNIGMGFEITEDFQFDTTIVAVIDKGKVLYISLFGVEKRDYILEYNGGDTFIKYENN